MRIQEILLYSASDAFLNVGILVAIILFLIGYIRYKHNNSFLKILINKKKLQPLVGVLIGLTPGCSGAILLMPLFIKGYISYGGILAALIVTMGESSLVLLTRTPKIFILINIITIGIALTSGYLCDYFKLGKKFKNKNKKKIKTKESKEVDKNGFSYKFTHGIGYKIFTFIWVSTLILTLLSKDQNGNENIHLDNLVFVLGIIGTLYSIFYMIVDKKFLKNDSELILNEKRKSLKEVLIYNSTDTAFVVSWVYISYLIHEFALLLFNGQTNLIKFVTCIGGVWIIIGALVGLIPGCGAQIVFVTLFTQGLIPFAGLLANSISQKGDCIFLLMKKGKKCTITTTIITTLLSIIFGLIFYYLF